MSSFKSISKEEHLAYSWKAYPHYGFAAHEHAVPLLPNELHLLVCHFPLAFLAVENGFIPVVLQGLYPGQNLFVNADGTWLKNYVPRHYALMPFGLALSETGNLVVCISEECLVPPHKTGDKPLFNVDGTPATELAKITQELGEQEQGRQRARHIAKALAEAELIVPWEVKVKVEEGKEVVLNGLFKIDEEKLSKQTDKVIADLNRSGALYLAHCQLISIQHLQTLVTLQQLKTKTAQQESKPKVAALNLLDDNGTLSFAGL